MENEFPILLILIFLLIKWYNILQVLNDCMGFVGPLLLNKLLQFLQQGFYVWLSSYILFLTSNSCSDEKGLKMWSMPSVI